MASFHHRVPLAVVAYTPNALLLSSADNECFTSLLSVKSIWLLIWDGQTVKWSAVKLSWCVCVCGCVCVCVCVVWCVCVFVCVCVCVCCMLVCMCECCMLVCVCVCVV